jgi:maleate isomerase
MWFNDDTPLSATELIRVGMIVPSSNVTMERELPAMLRARERVAPQRFSFHASRVRMRSVTPAELAAMNEQAARAAGELGDAEPDAVVFACLVAVMAEGAGAHRWIERRLADAAAEEGRSAPVISSAGALVETLRDLGAERVALVAPYLPQLTERVCGYLGAEGVEVVEPSSRCRSRSPTTGRSEGCRKNICWIFARGCRGRSTRWCSRRACRCPRST